MVDWMIGIWEMINKHLVDDNFLMLQFFYRFIQAPRSPWTTRHHSTKKWSAITCPLRGSASTPTSKTRNAETIFTCKTAARAERPAAPVLAASYSAPRPPTTSAQTASPSKRSNSRRWPHSGRPLPWESPLFTRRQRARTSGSSPTTYVPRLEHPARLCRNSTLFRPRNRPRETPKLW